jgi:DNA-binding MarR family transcriptional regulator
VARTGIDRSTLADIVARLLSRGLIQRRRAKEDGRAYAIKLSAKGTKALAKAKPAASAADAKLLAGLSATKRNEFMKTLSAVVAAGED